MLFKLSLKNIKKSFKDYAIYFFTLILGVTIFYSFNSLQTQSVMLNLTKANNNSINMISTVLSAISVFVALVLGFLIIYANRFLMKRRNKEFGIYMTLGMGKGKISRIILFETILVGIISLVIGIILGLAVSQVMSIAVANLFEADMNKFKFVISYSAIIKTVICFLIIYTFVMLFNIVRVNKCTLIDLIKSNQKSEEIKIKNPYISIIIFILGVGMLSYAYYNVTLGVENLQTSTSLYIQILYGVVGTFLVFWSLSGILLKTIMSMKNIYFKNLNSFTLRQISSKINATVASMSIICIMLFITICIFSTSISMNSTLKSDMQSLAGADISIKLSNKEVTIKEILDNKGLNVNEDLRDIVDINTYSTNQVTKKETYGSYYKTLESQFASQGVDTTDMFNEAEILVKISDYNKIAKLYNKQTYTLNNNQFMIISDYKNSIEWYNNGLKDGTSFKLNGKTYTAKYKECKDGYLMMRPTPDNVGFIVVPDNAVNESMISGEFLAANYNKTNKLDKQTLEDKIVDIKKSLKNTNMPIFISTKIDIYNDNIGTGAMVIFVGLYVGIVFLISSAAILSLKELSDATDSKNRYIALRKMGVDEKMINKSLFTQVSVFFGFPLVLAVIHSIFGIQVANMMVESFTKNSMIESIALTSLSLILIYGGYFIVTYLCSKNIIKED